MVAIGEPARILYTNYRGETAERTITPKRVWYGISDWHPGPQWFLTAFDHDKNADRDFALIDFGHPQPSAAPHPLDDDANPLASNPAENKIAPDTDGEAPAATDTGLETVGYWLTGHTAITTCKKEWSSWKLDPYTDALVTRSQAEELLAAERAEKDRFAGIASEQMARAEKAEAEAGRWHTKAMDAGVIVHTDGTTSHPMRKEMEELKADNAAKDARIKELEKDFYDADKSDMSARDLLNDCEAQIEALEAKVAAAEKALDIIFKNPRSETAILEARAVLGGDRRLEDES